MKFNSTIGAALICRNHEKYIAKAIDSLLDQSYKLEKLVIVDDNSEDSTTTIIEKYIEKYKNIKLIKNNLRLGPSQSSNLAFQQLETDFIIYTSGDDYSTSNRAVDQMQFLINNPQLSCVVSQVNLFSDGDLTEFSTPQFRYSKNSGIDLFKELFWGQNFLNASAACFRNKNLKANLFNLEYIYLQDFALWLDLSLERKIGISDNIVLHYRISQTSLSQSVNYDLAKFNDMNYELFTVLTSKLLSMNFEELFDIYHTNIKPFARLNIEKSDKDILIIFIMLSHRNSNLNRFTFEYILNKYSKKEFLGKLNHYFEINRASYSILEKKLSKESIESC